MIFTSKKDIWMGIIIWSVITGFIWMLYQSIFVQFDIIIVIITSLMIFFKGAIWFNTNYKIEEDVLTISYGPIKKRIDIKDIQSIEETTNPFVAPALSMYKIVINYGKYETTSISPKNKKAFVSELLIKKSQIQKKLKK